MAEFGFVMSQMMPLGCRGGKNRLANSFEIRATGRDSPGTPLADEKACLPRSL